MASVIMWVGAGVMAIGAGLFLKGAIYCSIFDRTLEWGMGIFILGSIIALTALGFAAADEWNVEHARLMKQCMDSGKAEFECVAMLQPPQSNTTVVPVPIIIHFR